MGIFRNKKLQFFFIAFIYTLFIYLISIRTGIITRNEAEKYLIASHELLNGNFSALRENFLFYSSYIVFMSLFLAAGGVKAVIIAQVAISFLAANCIKKSITKLLKNDHLSTAGMFIFLFSFPIQSWNITLFSDGFFVSVLAITLFYTLKEKTKKEYFIWLFLIVILIFARPPGIFFSILFALYFVFIKQLLPPKLVLIIGITIFVIIFWCLFYFPVESKGYIKPIAAGSIVVNKSDYDIPQFNNLAKSNLVSAYQYLYLHHGCVYIIKLYIKKLISFFTLTRPYYSRINNLILSLHYLFYPLSILGLFSLKKMGNIIIAVLFLLSIFFAANLVGLTYNEWHYRFTLEIFPFLIILSIVGINFLTNLRNRKNSV